MKNKKTKIENWVETGKIYLAKDPKGRLARITAATYSHTIPGLPGYRVAFDGVSVASGDAWDAVYEELGLMKKLGETRYRPKPVWVATAGVALGSNKRGWALGLPIDDNRNGKADRIELGT